MAEDVLRISPLSLKLAALRVLDLPLSVFSSLPRVSLSAGTKKLVAATAFGASKDVVGSRQNLSLCLTSKNGFSCHVVPNGSLYSKLSGSLQSLASVKSMNSCSSCTCPNGSSCWDRADESELRNIIPVTTPENLYLMVRVSMLFVKLNGMELFEEALRRWEQALTFRSRLVEDEASCASVKAGGWGRHRGGKSGGHNQCRIHPQAGVPAAEGPTASRRNKHTDVSAREDLDDSCLRDSVSIASTDSFVSAAELSEHREMKSAFGLGSLCHYPFYDEALRMAEDGKISCRVLRTEMLECLGDTDFLAKLHCVRQACQVILREKATRMFLADTGKKILSSIIVKGRKSPKRFEEVFEDMICFLEQMDHWENTEAELATRGVKHLNFYDIVLDFILMDSFEDLENPPISIQNVVNNRWLNSSFKETAVASSCWSVLKQKRQHMKVQDGFIAHFYAVCEHISPVLAWGFLGPKSSLHDFCCFFKDQVLFFLKDIFDLEKVRYSSVETLAEDILHLLHRRSELLLAYLGADSLRHISGCIGTPLHLVPSALLETRVQ
ncbi:hypothetical protein SRHO_G00017630 [Serrasalmus rhombeus]